MKHRTPACRYPEYLPSGWVLPPQFDLGRNSIVDTPRDVSMVTLHAVKLTIKIHHHRWPPSSRCVACLLVADHWCWSTRSTGPKLDQCQGQVEGTVKQVWSFWTLGCGPYQNSPSRVVSVSHRSHPLCLCLCACPCPCTSSHMHGGQRAPTGISLQVLLVSYNMDQIQAWWHAPFSYWAILVAYLNKRNLFTRS